MWTIENFRKYSIIIQDPWNPKKHQNDIATHTKYSLKDYDDGKKDKKHKDNTETRKELMKQIEDK